MMIRCMTVDSWYKAAKGESDFIITRHPVPPMLTFRVYVGKRKCPELLDAYTRFRSMGSRPIGFGLWITRVALRK